MQLRQTVLGSIQADNDFGHMMAEVRDSLSTRCDMEISHMIHVVREMMISGRTAYKK